MLNWILNLPLTVLYFLLWALVCLDFIYGTPGILGGAFSVLFLSSRSSPYTQNGEERHEKPWFNLCWLLAVVLLDHANNKYQLYHQHLLKTDPWSGSCKRRFFFFSESRPRQMVSFLFLIHFTLFCFLNKPISFYHVYIMFINYIVSSPPEYYLPRNRDLSLFCHCIPRA